MSDKKIYSAMAAVMKELEPIPKMKEVRDRSGKVMYNYRGIDDVYANCHNLCAEHGVMMLSDVEYYENKIQSIQWHFVSTVDGSMVTSRIPASVDVRISPDIGSLLSYTQRYALESVFLIPTEETHQKNPETKTTNVKPQGLDGPPPDWEKYFRGLPGAKTVSKEALAYAYNAIMKEAKGAPLHGYSKSIGQKTFEANFEGYIAKFHTN